MEKADAQEITVALKKDETSDNTDYLIDRFHKSIMVQQETKELQVGVALKPFGLNVYSFSVVYILTD